MKELYNILSNSSDFFLENRLVFGRNISNKVISAKDLNKALNQPLEKVFPETKKNLLKTPTKAQLKRQEEARIAEVRSKKNMDSFRKGETDYDTAMREAKKLRISDKDYIKAGRSLFYAIRDTGPETNKREDISPKVFKQIAKEIQKIPNYKKYIKAYHILSKYGTGERANQRRLVREVKDKLMRKGSDKLLAYLLKIEMGPVKIEPPVKAIASRKTATKPIIVAGGKQRHKGRRR